MNVETPANDFDDASNSKPYITYHEHLRHAGRVWAAVWSLAEFGRLAAAGVAFIGPIYVLVSWVFDILQSVFNAGQYPGARKEWFFYVLLIAAFLIVSLPVWALSDGVQSLIRRRFPNV